MINDPKEFFVHRPRLKNDGSKVVGWFEMNKGVANMYRYARLASGLTIVIWRGSRS